MEEKKEKDTSEVSKSNVSKFSNVHQNKIHYRLNLQPKLLLEVQRDFQPIMIENNIKKYHKNEMSSIL